MIDWGAIVEKVLLAVIAVALPILLKMLADWLKLKRDEFENGISDELSFALREAARIAVLAAEQSGLAKLIEDTTLAKKRYALDIAERYLHERGFDIDLDLIAAAIEAAVKEQFHPEPAHPVVLIGAAPQPAQPLPSDVGL